MSLPKCDITIDRPPRRSPRLLAGAALLSLLGGRAWSDAGTAETRFHAANDLWSGSNIAAWCDRLPFEQDLTPLPETRAEMLVRLGFHKAVYYWAARPLSSFDSEIEALQQRHIELVGWVLAYPDRAVMQASLDAFRRHHVRPAIWLLQTLDRPSTAQKEAATHDKDPVLDIMLKSFPATRQEEHERLRRETDRIGAFAGQASAYGVRILLYNHNGWFGIEDNEIAIIEGLRRRGVTNVGLVYNFSHARDQDHDDIAEFPTLWPRIQRYVEQVNVTGAGHGKGFWYPAQGDHDVDLMRTIEESGWQGPVGLIAEKCVEGGDREATLRNYRTGLEWLTRELREPGSGGPRPFPVEKP